MKRSNLGITYADHNVVDAFLRQTEGIDLTVVRLVLVSNADQAKNIMVTMMGCLNQR